MNKKLFFNKKHIRSFVFLVGFLLLSSSAIASHYRHGTISWRVVSGNTVEFKISQAWANYGNWSIGQTGYGDRFNFGDGQQEYFRVVITAVNSSENWYYGETTFTHTYANMGNFTAYFSSCCKIGQLSNNANAVWRNETIVNVGSGNESPVTTMAPIINMQGETAAATFQVPASDPDGDNLTYRLATYNEIRGSQPSGISIDPNTGVLTFNTNGRALNSLWNAAIVVEDGQTKVINDFIIKIVQQSNPPVFDYAITPANGSVYQVSPGVSINFSVKADDSDPGATVSLQSIGVPLGASVTLSNQNTSSITGIFNWTPTVNNLGTNVINFLAQDNVGTQVSTSVTIFVSLKPQFDTPAQGIHNVYNPGDVINYTVQASDPDPLDVVQITDVKGKNMAGAAIPLYNNASFSNLNGIAANPTSGIFTWNTQASDWGHKHVFFYATDSYGDVTKHEVSQLINTPPVFTSTPILTADIGAPYSALITIADADISFGDAITILGNTIPSWLTLTDNGNGTASLIGTPSVGDVGNAAVNIQAEDINHHQDPRGTINQVFDITVNNCQVNAITKDIIIVLDASGSAILTVDEINNGSNATCGVPVLMIDKTTFSCADVGANTVTLTVTDASGNIDSATANVTILEHFKETLDLRSLSSFEAFTGTGAVTNSGTFTGNVGTNVGALTGFTGPDFNGSIHFNDALTAQAELDLLKVYIHLNNVFVTHPGSHAPAFGSGETLTAGVYDIGGAGSVAGTLTLDGQGDPNAVFIMKFKGAFTAGAASNIILINGADAANVFWVAQGALSVGANSTIKGTLLAYPGAITLGVNSSIEGRLLSSVGAITVGVGGTATMPAGTMNLPINPMVSYTPAAAVDVLGSIENFSLFTSNGAVANASTSGILGDVGADLGAISGFATSAHIGSFYNADAVTAQAKIDLNNAYSQLMLIPTTVSNHTPAFGSGETLQAGVYSTPGAGSLAGTITLDGQNDPDAIFIFKFNGAFAAGAQSKVILSNGTRRCNVFWISEGAASIGSFSTVKGTILAHGGAATMGAGGNLEGRLLSTGGAIGFSTGVVYTVVHDVECDYSTAQKTTVKTAVKEAIDADITSFEEELQVYPNPSKGIFNIKLSTLNIQTDIYLFDTTGKLIVRKSISKENNSGDLIRIGSNNLSSGIYLVKIITNNKAVTKKVIVEKR
jgi:hypothetical protein